MLTSVTWKFTALRNLMIPIDLRNAPIRFVFQIICLHVQALVLGCYPFVIPALNNVYHAVHRDAAVSSSTYIYLSISSLTIVLVTMWSLRISSRLLVPVWMELRR
jgi:hypothetical protein